MFAAGDIGGARALLPVARRAADAGHDVLGLAHGPFRAEGDARWHWLEPQSCVRETNDLVRQAGIRAVLYATSVRDWAAWEIAQAARDLGCPIVHCLDNWSSYKHRLCGPRGDILVPDIYAVPDALAYRDAVAEGVPETCLAITGHPALAALYDEIGRLERPAQMRSGQMLHVMFVSEPAALDSGAATDPFSRGYDEIVVSNLFAACIAQLSPPGGAITVHVAPHPREDREAVARRWDEIANAARSSPTAGFDLCLVGTDEVRHALHHADAVVGMTSLLLYEAWLLGKPVASLQPGLRNETHRALALRKGVVFCDTQEAALTCVPALLEAARSAVPRPEPDLSAHASAPELVLKWAEKLAWEC